MRGTCHCGAVCWTLADRPDCATACSCSLCRRYGTLWAYGYEGHGVRLDGDVTAYARADASDPMLDVLFCRTCGCVAAWRGRGTDQDGRRRMAVNLRLAEPEEVADIEVEHLNALHSFEDFTFDDRRVRDMWF
ncbi:GFA family protein [Pseudooceanicola sp. C21-150M6]|uniref:GFA family protein n=1 Tax=Pseudooceanicola sp. C21-150M6 TaxID=3434355 RepID=UPI003D7F9460